jgi:glucokinase
MPDVIGIDLGATNIRAGLVSGSKLKKVIKTPLGKTKKKNEVLKLFYSLIDRLITKDVMAIGVGVPSVVDTQKGIVYDVVNIPSWKEVHIKELLEKRYKIPVRVNNDANCFALGEKHFGKGRKVENFIGLTIGTGLGAGIILNNKLYKGHNCGAGEFGMIPYKDDIMEAYAAGVFFEKFYNTSGSTLIRKINDPVTRKIFSEYGHHLGAAIKIICYTYDPQLIILGGSIAESYPYFKDAMWKEIETIQFKQIIKNLQIEVSELKYPGLLGAAALVMQE